MFSYFKLSEGHLEVFIMLRNLIYSLLRCFETFKLISLRQRFCLSNKHPSLHFFWQNMHLYSTSSSSISPRQSPSSESSWHEFSVVVVDVVDWAERFFLNTIFSSSQKIGDFLTLMLLANTNILLIVNNIKAKIIKFKILILKSQSTLILKWSILLDCANKTEIFKNRKWDLNKNLSKFLIPEYFLKIENFHLPNIDWVSFSLASFMELDSMALGIRLVLNVNLNSELIINRNCNKI